MRALVCLSLLLLLVVSSGCMMSPVPLSAQAGTTVSIPLNGRNAAGAIGYGSLAVPDAQRGELVYSLETSSGPVELTTRLTMIATAGAASAIAREWDPEIYQVVSLVDVPAGAPLGTYDLSVVRRYTDPATGTMMEDPISYDLQLSILPHTIDVVRDDGTTETVTGKVSPFKRCCNSDGDLIDITDTVPRTVPDPALHIALDTHAWALELEVSYPAGVIDILDAFESRLRRLNDRAAIWIDDDGSGNLTIKAVATHGGFNRIEVAFTLDDPNVAILDPADVSLSVIRAWDQDGIETTVVPTLAGIF